MTDKVLVEFEVSNLKAFIHMLEIWDSTVANYCVGYRIDAGIEKREALRKFVDQMELKLRKNDHKSDWREKPIQALFQLLLIEIEEFKALYDYFPTKEARRELVDIANFALICYDRMSGLAQDVPAKLQEETEDEQRARYTTKSFSTGAENSIDNSEVVGRLDFE